MRSLATLLFTLMATFSSQADFIEYSFNELELQSESGDFAYVKGSVRYDSAPIIDFNNWSELIFLVTINDSQFDLGPEDLSQINIVDLDDLVFGEEDDEGFSFAFSQDYSLHSGAAAIGEDTCLFTEQNQFCANSLFGLQKSQISADITAPWTAILLSPLALLVWRRR